MIIDKNILKKGWLMKIPFLVATALLCLFITGTVIAQEKDQYVTKKEHEKLQKELDSLKEKVESDSQFESYKKDPNQDYFGWDKGGGYLKAGSTKFLISGYATGGFTARENTDARFTGSFNPIWLWKLSDDLFFEGELEISSSGGVGLEIAQITYFLNDYVTFGAGKFLVPFGTFAERIHPTWINKLPDMPLAVGHGGIAPLSEVGIQARGGIPAGPVKFEYVIFGINGPQLDTTGPLTAGQFIFDNTTDFNKSVGGRIGFFPIPPLELSYSILWARMGLNNLNPLFFIPQDADTFLHSVDLNYTYFHPMILGTIDLRVQWVFSDVDDFVYDPVGVLGFGPVFFNNQRNGGYAQIAYRPSALHNFIGNFEGVFRYDRLDAPFFAPSGFDQERYTVGLNYWLGKSTVLKAAYEKVNNGSHPVSFLGDGDAWLFQAAMGF